MNSLSVTTNGSVENQKIHGDSRFPFVFVCETKASETSSTVAWVEHHRDELLRLMTAHGAVALRGFATETVDAFDAVIAALRLKNFPYAKSLSNAVRVNRTDRVFSANEAPPDVRIYFHHEMAQTPLFPNYIFFYCEVAAETGGATPLCRSDVLFQRLEQECPKFAERCRQYGLCYTNVMPDNDDPNSGMGRSWRSTLGVSSREAAEERLNSLGYSFEWDADGCLKATTPPLPAVMKVGDGQETFFNQLIAAYCGWSDDRNDPSKAIRHGNGEPLDGDAVQVAIALSEELCYDHLWKPGDVVLLDNRVAMHARRPFTGTRKILASLAEMQTHRHELPT